MDLQDRRGGPGRIDDRDHVIDVYERNNAEVEAAFDGSRLLRYELGSGWEPLCRFLELPVPDAPFPRSNSAQEFNESFANTNEAP